VITSLVLGAVAAALMAIQPRIALLIGLTFPAVQAFYSPPLLRLVVIGALLVGLLLGWRHASRRQRSVLGHLWLGVLATLLIGWVLASDPSTAQGMVLNLLYAAVVASLAVVYRLTATEWNVYVMAWGSLVSIWLASHDVVVIGRGRSLYIGENANALGMLAALGVVGAIGLAMRRPMDVRRTSVGALAALLCALGTISSGSRGALLVAAAGVAVHVALPALRRSRVRALATVAVLGGATYWIALPALTWFLLKAGRKIDATGEFDVREHILRASIQAGLDNPLSGVGFANLQLMSGTISPHNAYVGLFAATGALPTIFLGILLFVAVARARVSQEGNMLPLLVAALVIGFSLDWIPTAKLGPIVLALLACCAALSAASGGQEPEAGSARLALRPGRRRGRAVRE
jgi:O-antigen ligase